MWGPEGGGQGRGGQVLLVGSQRHDCFLETASDAQVVGTGRNGLGDEVTCRAPGKEVLRVTAARPPPDPALGETQRLGHPAEHRE